MVWETLAATAAKFVGDEVSKANSAHPEDTRRGAEAYMRDAEGIGSVVQGSNTPPPGTLANVETSGSTNDNLIKDLATDAFKTGFNAVIADGIGSSLSPSASELGKNSRTYMDAMFPELNPWEKAGAGASMAGMQAAEQTNAQRLQAQHIQGQKDITRMNNEAAVKIAGINADTSRMNTKDMVYAQNELLQSNKDQIQANTRKILQDTSMSTTQQAHEMVKMVNTQLQAQGIRLNNENLAALTDKIRTEIHNMQTSKSELGKTVNDVSNVLWNGIQDIMNKTSGVGSAIHEGADWIGGRFRTAFPSFFK